MGAGLIKNPRKNISATNILAPSPKQSREMKTIEIDKTSEISMSAGSGSVDSDTDKKRKPMKTGGISLAITPKKSFKKSWTQQEVVCDDSSDKSTCRFSFDYSEEERELEKQKKQNKALKLTKINSSKLLPLPGMSFCDRQDSNSSARRTKTGVLRKPQF